MGVMIQLLKRSGLVAAVLIGFVLNVSGQDRSKTSEGEGVAQVEAWTGRLEQKDVQGVELLSGGKKFLLVGSLERDLHRFIGKEVTITGRLMMDGTIDVNKAEPVLTTKSTF